MSDQANRVTVRSVIFMGGLQCITVARRTRRAPVMILEEFKKFALRGNLADLAAGIVIGAAFTSVVGSFVSDILMPPIGLVIGRVDFQNLFINLSHRHFESVAAAKAAGAPTLNYGIFINQIL